MTSLSHRTFPNLQAWQEVTGLTTGLPFSPVVNPVLELLSLVPSWGPCHQPLFSPVHAQSLLFQECAQVPAGCTASLHGLWEDSQQERVGPSRGPVGGSTQSFPPHSHYWAAASSEFSGLCPPGESGGHPSASWPGPVVHSEACSLNCPCWTLSSPSLQSSGHLSLAYGSETLFSSYRPHSVIFGLVTLWFGLWMASAVFS